jgi:hypothetical protein
MATLASPIRVGRRRSAMKQAVFGCSPCSSIARAWGNSRASAPRIRVLSCADPATSPLATQPPSHRRPRAIGGEVGCSVAAQPAPCRVRIVCYGGGAPRLRQVFMPPR